MQKEYPCLFETKRLRIREFQESDCPFILQLTNSPKWIKYIGDRNIKNVDDAVNYLQNGPFKSYKKFGFGLWMVELKASKTPIGMCGLLKRDELDDVDIGFALLPSYFGNGYAYEMAKATLDYGHSHLGIERIIAICHPKNEASIHLLRKIGLLREEPYFSSNSEQLLLLST